MVRSLRDRGLRFDSPTGPPVWSFARAFRAGYIRSSNSDLLPLPGSSSVRASSRVFAYRAAKFLALITALAAPPGASARAQSPAQHRLAPLLTLELWAENVWLSLTDRDGSYFGRLAEQGTFQRFNPLIHREYELDLRTGLFGEDEDARWAAAARGLRVAGASIGHPFILNFADWRERVPISERVQLLARFRRQRSLTEQRDYPNVGVSWTPARGSPWTLGVGIGMHFFKASADVEVALGRRWAGQRGVLSLDTRFAFLDAFSNVIFDALGVEPEETPAHFTYAVLPVAARITATWSAPETRVELHAGTSNRGAVEVSFPASGDPSYRQEEQVGFAGALAEWAPERRLRFAAYVTSARATTDRVFSPTKSAGFRLRERTETLGLRGAAALRGSVVFELGVGGVWRPEDRDRDDGSTVRHRDREVHAHLSLARRPVTGSTWRLRYDFDDRAAGVLAPLLTEANHRLPTEFGYRFRSGFQVTVGVRWDLDEGSAYAFDGGHLRFTATW